MSRARFAATTIGLAVAVISGCTGSSTTPPLGRSAAATPPTTSSRNTTPAPSPPSTSPTTLVHGAAPTSPPLPSAAPATAASRRPSCHPNGLGCAANRPLTVTVSTNSSAIRVGKPVTFEVTATDPDAKIDTVSCGRWHVFGDERSGSRCSASCIAPDPATVYEPTAGREQDSFTHTYLAPGSYRATFAYHSGQDCSGNPYADDGQGGITITVT
jgi:hypothetical protein